MALGSIDASGSLCTALGSVAAFDAKARAWEDYTQTPLGWLRQELALRHIVHHLSSLPPKLQILDVGGGTGSYALPLAQLGHHVSLLDFSAQMLSVAQQKARKLDPTVMERIQFRQTSVEEMPVLFGADRFDLILCHTLLEYLPEPWEVVRILVSVLRHDGLLSLLFANACADSLRLALVKGDLEGARLALNAEVPSMTLFGLPRQALSAQAVHEALVEAGMMQVSTYGVRIFADYLPRERLADQGFLAHLVELEMAASTVDPYRAIARYTQIFGRKLKRSLELPV